MRILRKLVRTAHSSLFAKALLVGLLVVSNSLTPQVFAQPSNATPLITVAKANPVGGDYFGVPVSVLGENRILVAAYRDSTNLSGAVYLFDDKGNLLNVITNPLATPRGYFGLSVTTMGKDRLIVGEPGNDTGAQDSGVVHLLNTNGAVLSTFTNPTPYLGEYFGAGFGPKTSAAGNDWIIVGSQLDDTGGVALDTGAAYLFNTNGTLVTTFLNPNQTPHAGFGCSVAVIGNDRVVIGAFHSPDFGQAYLFGTNGALLKVFDDPNPGRGNWFGRSIEVLANERFFVAAERNDIGAFNAGAVYLFDTSGICITTFTNPFPKANDAFGASLAAVGNDRVLIGAPGDLGLGPSTGAVYLFSTNGALLSIFSSPTGIPSGGFGSSVAALGRDRVVVGTIYLEEVYVFSIPYPPLSIARNASTVSVGWVTPESGLFLQESGLLGDSAVWNSVTESVSANGPTNVVQQPLGTTNRFYRLRRP